MKNKKTINIVCYYGSLYGGNFIPSILLLANALTNYVIIFTFPLNARGRYWADYLIKCGYCVEYIDFSNKTFKKDLKKINKIHNVSTIYTHFVSGLRIKLVYPFNKKIKLIIHVHSDFSGGVKESFMTKLKSVIEHYVLRKDSKYIYVSDSMQKKYSKLRNHYFVSNALSVNRIPFSPHINSEGYLSKINANDTVFLTFAWSPYVKGVDITVKAFFEGASSKSKLLIIYGKDDGCQKCIEYLKKTLNDIDFLNDKRILFLPPSENGFDYYENADVFISSSRSEGFSYSVLEALYFNLDVFCSNIDGTLWASKYDKVSLFNNGDYKSLSKLIKNVCGYKKPNIKSQEIANDYNIDLWCKKIVKIIN